MPPDDKMSLKDSVLNAFTEAEKADGAVLAEESTTDTTPEGGDKVEEKVSPTEDKGTAETEKEEQNEEETIEFDASPDEIRQALTLVKQLSNPETAAKTLRELAELGDYDLSSKKETKQLVRDTKTILKERLGDNYDILAGDKLAEALEEVLQAKVGEVTKPHLERIAQAEMAANQQKADTAMDALWDRNKISDLKQREKISSSMLEKMKILPAGSGADINTYLDDIYSLVTRDTDRARTVKTTVKRIQENAKEVSRTSGVGDDESRVRKGSKLPTIRESVEAAFRGEKLD